MLLISSSGLHLCNVLFHIFVFQLASQFWSQQALKEGVAFKSEVSLSCVFYF